MKAGHYQAALDAAIGAAREAGELLRIQFHRPGGPRGSGIHADIDEQAEHVIREKILAAFPAAYRGEETGTASGWRLGAHLAGRSDRRHLGLPKGLEGQRGQHRLGSAGLPGAGRRLRPHLPRRQRRPVCLGRRMRPRHVRNGKPVTANLVHKDLEGDDGLPSIVFISQDADNNLAANAAYVAPARFIAMPSIAYRLALAATGEGVAAVSLHGPGDWDYAGGHALLASVGGVLIDQDGQPIGYGLGGESSCRWCFGGASAAADALCRRDWGSVYSSPTKPAAPFALVHPERGAAVPDPGRLSRAQGCLLGQLAGDSLGGLVEFRSAASIKREYPGGVRKLADGGNWGILAGQPTDDSEMALILARTLVHEKTYNSASALDAYLHWYDSPPFDIGGTTSSALGGAKRGKTPQERLQKVKTAANAASQANGSLMRISPLGISGRGTPLRQQIGAGRQQPDAPASGVPRRMRRLRGRDCHGDRRRLLRPGVLPGRPG